jgi:hypothetical protein
MMVACYLEPSKPKADAWMRAFAKGCNGMVVRNGEYAEADDHALMGNWPVAGKLIEKLNTQGTPFWYLDASYIRCPTRCLRIERSRFWPAPPEPGRYSIDRAYGMGVRLQPWRRTGRHVLVCLHGPGFGRPWGLNAQQWNDTIEDRVRQFTDRPIIVRVKPRSWRQIKEAPPLDLQLENAWCLVTHSSTIAVTAAIAGVPVFCEPTCPAATVGCTDISRIESPVMPDRVDWISGLAWRQWSRGEVSSGAAWRHVKERGE